MLFPHGKLHRRKERAHSTQTRLTFQMIRTNFVFSYQTNYRALHYHSEGVVFYFSESQPRARNLVASASVRRGSKLTYKVFGGCKLLLFADEKGVPKREVNILLAIVGYSRSVLRCVVSNHLPFREMRR